MLKLQGRRRSHLLLLLLLLLPRLRPSKILIVSGVTVVLRRWKWRVFRVNLMTSLLLSTLMLVLARWCIGLITQAFPIVITGCRSPWWHSVQTKTIDSCMISGWARVKKRCHRLIGQTKIHQCHISRIRQDFPRQILETEFVPCLQTVSQVVSW